MPWFFHMGNIRLPPGTIKLSLTQKGTAAKDNSTVNPQPKRVQRPKRIVAQQTVPWRRIDLRTIELKTHVDLPNTEYQRDVCVLSRADEILRPNEIEGGS